MKRPIAIGLSPNTEENDVLLAIKLLFSPWQYWQKTYVLRLEQWFRQYFEVPHAVSFASGRASLLAILKALGIGKDDEVVLQPFTCSVVVDAILETGALPVYADITSSFTLDPKDVAKKLTSKTKAILLQHTFGIPVAVEELLSLAKESRIAVIEDVAHTIGGKVNGKKLGSFGIAAFFSFGRDKAFSSVFGGMAITKDKELGQRIQDFQKMLSHPPLLWVAQQLLHPIASSIILPFYDVLSIGKVLLVLLQKLHLLSFPVVKREQEGKLNPQTIAKMPNMLAVLVLLQLERLEKFNRKREGYSAFYQQQLKDFPIEMPDGKGIPFLRFPVLVDNRDEALTFFRKHHVYLGKWYADIIDPKANLTRMSYELGSCPKAENLARRVLNLPTYPTLQREDAQRVVDLLKRYVENRRSH